MKSIALNQFACIAAVMAAFVLALSNMSAASPLMGLQAVEEPLPWFDSERNYPEYHSPSRAKKPNATTAVTSLGRPPMEGPASLRLSRFRYPAEDCHFDAIVRFDMELGQRPAGELALEVQDEAGRVLSQTAISPIPGTQLHFSYAFPEEAVGASGRFVVRWLRNGETAGTSAADFAISPPQPVERSGRVGMTFPNETGATMPAVPATVGVPFPQGVLESTDHLRLVDADGAEIPLQVKETARWSRFGSVKWVLCDFTVPLDGGPKRLSLEYGPNVRRSQRPAMGVKQADSAFPAIDAGRLRLDASGLSFDAAGDGKHRLLLKPEALAGAFVEHVDGVQFVGWGHRWMKRAGDTYRMPAPQVEIEEQGPEKTALRFAGWYEDPGTGRRFCKFVTRYVVHRESPVVRIFHTWIFTGDGNRDRIRNMGWRFPLADMAPAGFLSTFAEDAEWLDGYYLRQHDRDEYALFDYSLPRRGPFEREEDLPARPIRQRATGRRAPGVIAAKGNGARLYLGVRDFWQNYPRSLMQEEGALTFYEWPRYGREAQHPVTTEDSGNLWRLWFAHEGEALNFAMPRELTEGTLYTTQAGPEPRFHFGRPDSVNAQGVAKTSEMWLYVAPEDAPPADAVRVLHGLQEETLRPVVDPAWMTASGAFYEIAPRLADSYPEEEAAYEETLLSHHRHVERMGVYGKWIYGDLLTNADYEDFTARLYRAYRRAAWGYPYSWIPFVRSGDLGHFRPARSAMRMLSDVAFCHYVSEEVAEHFANLPPLRIWDEKPMFRRVGWWMSANMVPWSGFWGPTARSIGDEAEWLWQAWHLTGDARAKDVARSFAEQTKIEEPMTMEGELMGRGPITAGWNRGRWPVNLQKQYLEMYEATWDPWFLEGARAIAEMHIWRHREEDYKGHIWNTGPREYQRYTGCPEHEEFYLAYARHQADWQELGWASAISNLIPSAAFAHRLTGDEHFLRRLAGILDNSRWTTFTGDEPWFYTGYQARGDTNTHFLFAGWFQKWFPLALATVESAGGMPERPLPLAFNQAMNPGDRIAVRKEAAQELVLRTRGRYSIVGPDGETVREGEEPETALEADAPAGVYWLDLGRRSVRLPISPPDTPEVLVPVEGGKVGAGRDFAQHWFYVPEGIESFRIELDNTPYLRQAVRQIVVWDPDGKEVWAHRERGIEREEKRQTIKGEVPVAPDQSGRLWRITLPDRRGIPFRLDPRIPPVLAHDPWRWFDPEPSAAPAQHQP